MTVEAVAEQPLPFKVFTRGKVRDVYDFGEDLLIVASDRISAYDHVLPTPVPDKGKVLCGTSNFWFERLEGLCPNHLVATDVKDFPAALRPHAGRLAGRAVLVKKAKRVDVECVARGYLAGSGWKEYQEGGAVCGVKLPAGLSESSKLPEPIFTPATKAAVGDHDENIPFERMAALVGGDLAARLRALTLKIFAAASEYAASRGFLLADTKFEFGFLDGKVILIDEALTPDSSRFWDAAAYVPGKPQDSFDKQYVRDYLTRIGWNRRAPAPPLPEDVVRNTRAKYVAAYERLTGRTFVP